MLNAQTAGENAGVDRKRNNAGPWKRVRPPKRVEDETVSMNLELSKRPTRIERQPRIAADAIATCLGDDFSGSGHGA